MKNSPIPREPARLEIDKIRVAYTGHTILDDVSFNVPHGAQVALVGPNGAGKSTLFKALVGLLPLQSGTIRVHDMPLGSHQDCVAYVPQREEVDWRFPVTVEDVVLMGRYGHSGWFSRPAAADRTIAHRSLEAMGIARLAGRSIGELSGGQQQRVFLARALAQEPHILLMDEPFTGVDAATQEETLQMLTRLKQEGVTVIVSTHDLNMAAQRFEQVLLLNHHLVAYGTPAEVFTTANIAAAFGGQVLYMEGIAIVDECCPPDEHVHGEAQ